MRASSRLFSVLGLVAVCTAVGCAAPTEEPADELASAVKDGRSHLRVTNDYVELDGRRVTRRELADWVVQGDQAPYVLVQKSTGRRVTFEQRDMGNGQSSLFAAGSDWKREVTWKGDDALRTRLADRDWGVRQEQQPRAGQGLQPRFWFIPIIIIAVVVVLVTPGTLNPPPAPEDPDLVGAAQEMKLEVKKLEIAVD